MTIGPEREPAPAYANEGPFALWHFSEDPDLGVFEPHVSATTTEEPAFVWAVDTRHAPMFWFPRDCPRGCIWVSSRTTENDRNAFFGQSASPRIHVMESAWVERFMACTLFAYRLPPGPFRRHSVGGYWTSEEAVTALDQQAVGNLMERHAAAGIELRITPSIWPFWDQVVESTVEFSGSRLGNAGPRVAGGP